MINDLVRRLTSREFLAGAAIYILLLLNFERGYGLSEDMSGAIIMGLTGLAVYRVATKNGAK